MGWVAHSANRLWFVFEFSINSPFELTTVPTYLSVFLRLLPGLEAIVTDFPLLIFRPYWLKILVTLLKLQSPRITRSSAYVTTLIL